VPESNDAVAQPVGEGDWVVRQGDALESIAERTGFFWDTIWSADENADLRKARKDPHVLLPGDRVHIPELRRRDESGGSDQRHRFRRKGVPSKLRIVFETEEGARANEPYELELDDGTLLEGQTDGEGVIEHPISPNARKATLRIGDPPEEYELGLAHLDPVDSIKGQQARLANLGLYTRTVDGKANASLASALRLFQETHELEISGTADQATRDKLIEIHGA
jgi:N-acetylmuramoyl-L-alanine amidase